MQGEFDKGVINLKAVIQSTKSMSNTDYFKMKAVGSELPLLDKPCHDCAITTGFYTPIADDLLKEDEELQDAALKTWFCHNHCDKACRGARNYVNSMNKKKEKANA